MPLEIPSSSATRRARPAARATVCALAILAGALGVSGCAAKKAGGPQGPLVFVSAIMDGTITVVEPSSGKTRRFDVGSLPHNLELSPDGREVLVANTGSSSVSIFDARTGDFKRHVRIAEIPDNPYHRKLPAAKLAGATSCHACHQLTPVGELTNQATYTPDGRSLWVVRFNPPSLQRQDAASGRSLETLPLPEKPFPTQPSNVVYTPDGQEMIVLHRRRGQVKLVKPGGAYKGATGMAAFDHAAPPGNQASLITFHSPDGHAERGRVIVPLSQPFKASFSPDGRTMYVAYRSSNKVAEIDVAGRRLLRLFDVGEGPINAIVDREGKYLYSSSFYGMPPRVAKLELKTGLVRALLPAETTPATVAQDPDSGLLYIAANTTNRLLEVDPSGNGRILRKFPVGAFPLDTLVVPEAVRRQE